MPDQEVAADHVARLRKAHDDAPLYMLDGETPNELREALAFAIQRCSEGQGRTWRLARETPFDQWQTAPHLNLPAQDARSHG